MNGFLVAPQSLNRYSYVLNDPVSFEDPLGLICQPSLIQSKVIYQGEVIYETPGTIAFNCSPNAGGASERQPLEDGGPVGGGGIDQIKRAKLCLTSGLVIPRDGSAASEFLRIALSISTLLSKLTEKTAGVGIAGGAGGGINPLGPNGPAIGTSLNASGGVFTDRTGQSAIVFNATTTLPALTQPNAGFDGTTNNFGLAANVGLQATVDRRNIQQMITGPTFGASGSMGPVAADINPNGVSMTAGAGAGSRVAAGPMVNGSIAIPVCAF